ncbi:alpha/beta fold hydrolase [Alteromonas sp. ASW11-36]|uniref:Proline iminopeptidase n=1 Tax=Alteromonas arenosi TaxID=3055817 RepID=A0ABT7SW29_9ALTE|nr:alpha/beta fold hydrolase [Alteromonas sp. ASW11-36]MDM7860398.1 alpha/beta fold hydrolase [Alteromonas sp. ASW11-36]
MLTTLRLYRALRARTTFTSLAAILFTQLLFTATANAQQSEAISELMEESNLVTVVCPFKDEIDYEPERLRCGMLSVPENRDDPNSRMIRLTYAHIIASARNPDEEAEESDEEEPLEVREDPVAYLTGGPGVGIEYYVERFLDHDLTKTRDMYILNQRGIGFSDEFCRFYSATSRENMISVTLAENEVETAERMQACFTAASASGVDLTAYNTYENARDVKSLREALGFDQWNVWGISYGSHLGQMLTQVDPEGIKALVLDAIVPNDLGDLMRIHRWIGRNHELIFNECERQDADICKGLRERFYAAYNSLVENPITVEAYDEELFPSGNVTVPSLIVGFAPFAMQYEQDEHPAIPAVMDALSSFVESGDESIFKGLAAAASPFGGVSQGMSDAIRCNDGYFAAQAQVAAEDLNENFGFNQGVFTVEGAQLIADACVESGLTLKDRKHYQLVQSDIPTLIVNGDWDPITPTPLAERIAPGFSNGRLIIVPYAGHGPTRSMSECATQVMNDFFDAPTQDLADLDASCLEAGADAPEFLTYLKTDATLRIAALAAEDEKNLVAPAMYIGTLVLIIVSGFIAIICGAIARRVSNNPQANFGVGPQTPRLLAFAAVTLSLVGLGFIGAGAKAAADISSISFLAGLAPPAHFGTIVLLLSAAVGLWAMYAAIRTSRQVTLRRRTLIGLPLLGLSTALLFVYLASWGLSPF